MTDWLVATRQGTRGDGVEGSTFALAGEQERLLAGGRYRLGAFLGRGVSKQVFLAHDMELGRDVAVSFLGLVVGEVTVLRYRREIRAMAQLGDHPNIVTVYDVGFEDGLTYIVSQYIPGGSLSDRVRGLPGRRMAPHDAIAVARDVVDALEHAHAHGVVHRDLKPGNILLDDRGVALLSDFGMAVTPDDARITADHAFIGTLPYMAPEQGRGHPVDARSDFYSLGVTLFELLSGDLPFAGPDPIMILSQHATAPRPSLAATESEFAPQLDALIQRLMAADPNDRPASAGEVRELLDEFSPRGPATPLPNRAPERVRLPAALSGDRGAAFVGRTEPLAALWRIWERMREGRASVVLLQGNAGIGKTSVCSQFAQKVHAAGGTVIYGRCEEEALAPYGPFTEALRHYALYHPRVPDGFELPVGFELARLGWPVPGANAYVRPGTAGNGGDRAAERYQVFEAAVGLVKAMAGPVPLLAIFDDLHWADVPTLRMLRHLVRHSGSAEVMLVGTLRDDEPGRDERRDRALEDIRREPAVHRLELGGLSEEETAELVAARGHELAAPDVIGRLRERTAGNPFYIEETLHGVRDLADLPSEVPDSGPVQPSVPSGVERLILRRLSALGPETRGVLGAAAVIGREFSLGLLAALVAKPRPRVSDALEESIRDGIVEVVPEHVDRFAFRHALVRVTLYGSQPPSQRMALHAQCGEALEARYADSDAHAAELAHHFFAARHAGQSEKALRYSIAAGRWASASLAHEEAVAHRDRALELLAEAGPDHDGERCDLLLARGRALWRIGEVENAQETFRTAAALARRLDDAERFASAALGFGRRYYDPGETQVELVALLDEALRRLGERDSGWRARVLAGLAQALHFREPPAHVQSISREAVAIARRLRDDDALVVALASLHGALLHTQFLPERQPIGQELLALLDRRRPDEHGATALNWRLYDLFELGDMATARHEHARLTELAERLRQPLYLHFAAAWEAKWSELAGRFQEAEELARRSLVFARRAHMPYAESNYLGQLFGLLRDQGLLDTLLGEADGRIDERMRLPVWQAGMVLARIDADECARARADFAGLVAHDCAAIPADLFWLGAMCLLAEACARLDDEERAVDLYARLEPYAERNAQIGLAVSVGTVHRFLGLLARVTRRWAVSQSHFEAAIARSTAMGAIASLAHIRCDYAAMLLQRAGAGDRERADEHLAEALRVAGELSIRPIAQRVDALRRGPA